MTKAPSPLVQFLDKIPLVFYVLVFFVQFFIMVAYLLDTLIPAVDFIVLVLFIAFVSYGSLLIFFRKKDFFYALGVNQFILLLVIPLLTCFTLMTNYYISSPYFEETYKVADYEYFYDYSRDMYKLEVYDAPDYLNEQLYFYPGEFGLNSKIHFKVRRGVWGYKILEEKTIY